MRLKRVDCARKSEVKIQQHENPLGQIYANWEPVKFQCACHTN